MDTFNVMLSVAPGTLLVDQLIPNTRYGTGEQTGQDAPFHPHLVDIYEPRGTIKVAILALHGGGGNRRQYAATLGILTKYPPTPKGVQWGSLQNAQAALLVPQGQYAKGVDVRVGPGNNPWNPKDVTTVNAQAPNGNTMWSNRTMWSGVDDPQFIRDCSAFMVSRYGASTARILAGHSAGGIMTQRMWYEHQAGTFDCYCTTSGPASVYFRDTNAPPPDIVKPMFTEFGLRDINLNIYPGHFYESTWQLSSMSVAFVKNPAYVIGDFEQLQRRVTAYNFTHKIAAQTVKQSDGVVSAVRLGTQTSWRYSAGAMLLRLFSAADHSVQNLQRAAGRRHISDWVGFYKTTPGYPG